MSFFRFSFHVPEVESMGFQCVCKMLLCNLRLYCRLWRFGIWIYEPGCIDIGRDTTKHIKCVLVSEVWPNCKIRCFIMLGLAKRDLPTALLPLPILDEMLVGSEAIVQPRIQMYSSWGDWQMSFFRFPTHVPEVESMGSQCVCKMLLCNLRLYCRLWRFGIWIYEPGCIYIGRDTTKHIKCVLVSQVWPNCKIRCFIMFGLANKDLPTALLPLPILDEMLVDSEAIVQPIIQMYSSWGDKWSFLGPKRLIYFFYE